MTGWTAVRDEAKMATVIAFPKEKVVAVFVGATLSCQDCGAEFRVPKCRSETAKYCSRACADKHRGHRQEIKRVTLICAHCEGAFETPRAHQHRRKYCSRSCASRAWARATVGHRKSVKWAKEPGLTLHRDGYVLERDPSHPFASNGYVLQHRLVIERWLRANQPGSEFLVRLGNQVYLSPDFEVHHKDEDKTNNIVDNLECLTPEAHAVIHNHARRAAING